MSETYYEFCKMVDTTDPEIRRKLAAKWWNTSIKIYGVSHATSRQEAERARFLSGLAPLIERDLYAQIYKAFEENKVGVREVHINEDYFNYRVDTLTIAVLK
jgi:hypothetical protein